MIYHINTPEGERYTSESIEQIQANISTGILNEKCLIWHEGLPEWQKITDFLPDIAQKKEADIQEKALSAMSKVGGGIAKFASNRYKKATLKNRFSKALVSMLGDGVLDEHELQALKQMVDDAGAEWSEVVSDCQPIATQFIRHLLADALVDGEITDLEEENLCKNIAIFELSEIQKEVDSIIRRVRLCTKLRANILPKPKKLTPAWLTSGEAIYLKVEANRYNQKSGTTVSGDLWITGSRLEFISKNKPLSLKLKSLRGASEEYGRLEVLTNRASGNIIFEVQEPSVCAEYILCLMRAQNRTATIKVDESTVVERRKISQEVRQAVWIRDGGQCAECGAEDYLEYDHVIPVSKGGSNTVKNIQLLCRRCNSKKSDKI